MREGHIKDDEQDIQSRDEKSNILRKGDLLVAYLMYALEEVSQVSPSSVSYLLATVEDIQRSTSGQPKGNDIRKPS